MSSPFQSTLFQLPATSRTLRLILKGATHQDWQSSSRVGLWAVCRGAFVASRIRVLILILPGLSA